MRQELNQIELIEKYLLGELKGVDLEDFENRLKIDENLKEELEHQRLFIQGVENEGLKRSLNFIHQTIYESPSSFIGRNWLNLLAGGGFGIFIIAASFFAMFKGDDQHILNTELRKSNFDTRVNYDYPKMMPNEDFNFEDSSFFRTEEVKKISKSSNSINDKFPYVQIRSSYYNLDPNKDTTIAGEKGTLISIPKHCFVYDDGSELKNTYTFEMKEIYNISEILFQDLVFDINYKSYGTNGMVYLNATEKERPLKFDKNKNVNIRFYSSFNERRSDEGNTNKRDNIVYYKIFEDEPEKRLVNIPVDVLDYELNYISDVKEDQSYTSAYAQRHLNEKIESLTDEKYINTFVSTVQFHYRIEGCLLYGQGEELLDIYLKNINLKLWEADSIVAEYLKLKANNDCKNYGRYMKAEEYFRWLKSSRYGKVFNIPQLEYRNYHKGQIYNNVPHTREINRLQKWGMTKDEAVFMLNYFKKILYFKSKFKEAKRKNISLDYYYSDQGRYVEYKINFCGQAGLEAMELNNFFPIKESGWVNYEKIPDSKLNSEVKVNIQLPDTSAFIKTYLVLNKIGYISISDWSKKGSHIFENIPVNQPACLVGFSYFNNKLYYSRIEITTGKTDLVNLKLKPEEINFIQTDLSQLDK